MLRTPLLVVVTLLFFVSIAASTAHANGILVRAESDAPADARGPVRLKGHKVSAVVRNQAAEVTVEQVFHNSSGARLEGTYLFPLPKGAVVSKFAMTMAGKMVEGEVIESKRARAVYESIVRRRRDPGLLEYVGRGMFRARVFPIEPRQELTIRLTFQQLLPDDDGTLELRYPLATDRFSAAAVDAVIVDVRIESDVDLKAIYSPTHRVELTRDGDRKARVTYESNGRRQATDLLLYFARSRDEVGLSVLSHKPVGDDGTFMAVLAPKTKIERDRIAPKDVVYVLDTSGSMQGPKIEQARKALIFGVRSLRPNDRFNILAFSSGVHPFRDGLIDATGASREAAVEWISALEANGGTNIEDALGTALQLRPDDARPAMVVFLTDGLPSIGERDTGRLVARVKNANVSKARVFTFGVGYDLDVKLLDQIAETTGGTRDYVEPKEDIEIVTSRFFRKVNEPVLSDIEIDLGTGVYDVYPKSIPVLFSGMQIVLFGRYKEGGERTFTLKGTLAGEPRAYAYETTLRSGEGVAYLPRLWAYRKIAFLLDDIRLHGLTKEVRNEIVRLGTRHSIVTPYTSGLVVEDTEIDDNIETDNDLEFEERLGMRGLSDAPFEGPANNSMIGVGGGAGGAFGGRGGSADRAPGSGGKKRVDTVGGSGRWLLEHQQSDGSWKADGFGLGKHDHDVAVTGLAITTYLGAGYTNRGRHPFRGAVSKGLRYLKNVQDPEGHFGPRDLPGSAFGHATASLAMIEAYGMTNSPIFKGAAQGAVDYILASRLPGGGWAAPSKSNEIDLTVTSWNMLALASAHLVNRDALRRGHPEPFRVERDLLRSIPGWIAKAEPADSTLSRGAEALARIFAGADPRKDARVQVLADALAATPPRWDAKNATNDLMGWHFGVLAMHQIGGRHWKIWKDAIDDAIVDSQRKDGTHATVKSSWDPLGASPEAQAGGRAMSTALMSSCVQVYYRYDRVFGTRNVKPPSKEAQVRDSKILQREKERMAASETGGAGAGLFKTVGGKTFERKNGVWTDANWKADAQPVRVEAYSDAYFSLLRVDARAPKWLALGGHIRFMLDDDAYEIVPANKSGSVK